MSIKISTGSYDLNRWLDGGYENEVITMIAGPPGCGKTNFCILAACGQAKESKKVIYIDTEGGFSVERVKQIVGEKYQDFLENILLLEPTNFSEQKKDFDNLLKQIKSRQVGLIVIDSMAMHYRLELGDACQSKEEGKVKEINREVAKQMRILSEISRKQKIPIIITNQVYSEFLTREERENGIKKEINFVGGDLFRYWSKCIIELKNEQGRRAVLLKHRSLAEKEINFEIKDKGIFKKRLF